MRAMIWCLAFCSIVSMTAGTALAQTERRIALIVGNETYNNADNLLNPVNDARGMSTTLESLGFEVELLEDASYRDMQLALRDFGLKAQDSDVALVFFAGHGIQVGDQNYLLPVDARLQRERDLLYEALPLDIVLGEVAQAEQLGLVILDACRDNPLADNLRRSLGIRAGMVSSGLGRLDNVPSDTLVAYATRPGALTEDGRGSNSPYTEALIEHLPTQNLELGLFFRQVRDTVLRATDGRQEPFTYGSLGAEPFYFNKVAPNNDPEIAAIEAIEVLDNVQQLRLAIPMPTDPDGDPLSAEVISLPLSGDLQIGGRSLLIGDTLTLAQLGAVNYLPEGTGFSGEAGAFGFVVRDNRDGVVAASVPIIVKASNKPPEIVASRQITVTPILLGLPIPSDPDGDPLTVKVLSVPDTGTVRLDEIIVQPDDTLEAQDIPRLRFDPDYGFEGDAGAFVLEVTDGRGGRATSTLGIAVSAPLENLPFLTAAATPEPLTTRAIGAPRSAESATPEMEVASRNQNDAGLTRRATPAAPSLERRFEANTASNLREGPSTQSRRVGFLRQGEAVTATGPAEDDGRWWPVRTSDGVEGYVFASLLDGLEIPATEEPQETPADPPPPPQRVASLGTSPVAATGDAFADCAECPALVSIAGGRFVMGSDSGDHAEQPAIQVAIGEPFALGQYEVTVEEWLACVDDGGCDYNPSLDGLQPGHPIRNVSWLDARKYVDWLRAKTGRDYRLPTEAEWEFAARAGSQSRYWWGDDAGSGRANCEDCGGDYDRKVPAAVDALPANPLGLYGMNGGVAEWVEDCWEPNHEGAPKDGGARSSGQLCLKSVLRGGSWRNDKSYVTSSSRQGYDTASRYYANGFRVARDMD